MTPRKNLSKSVLIRMDSAMREEVLAVAHANKISTSAIIRMAVERQLPALRAGHTKLRAAR